MGHDQITVKEMRKRSKMMIVIVACFIAVIALGIVFRSNLIDLYNSHYLYVPSADRAQAKKDAVVAKKLAVETIKKKYGKDCTIIKDRASVDFKYDNYDHTFWIWVKTIDDEEIELEVSIGGEPYGNTVVDDYQIKEFFDDISRCFKAEIGIPESSDISVIIRRPEGTFFGSNGLEYKYESKDSIGDILEWYYAHGETFSSQISLPIICISVDSDDIGYDIKKKYEKRIQNAFGKYPVWITICNSAPPLDKNFEDDGNIHMYKYLKEQISDEIVYGEYVQD